MPGAPWNRLVAAPGQAILLGGPEGGRLLLQPPAQIAGQMTLADMQNRTWMLLREPGPDTGQAPPITGDFTAPTIQRDLNIALGQFISEAGIAPDISDRMDVFPVFPILDYPVPPGMQALDRIEYTPYGMGTYKLQGYSFEEFDSKTGEYIPEIMTGQPWWYRKPFAGYIRLQPQPGLGQAVGPGAGTLTIVGNIAPGQAISATINAPGNASVVTMPYTATVTDSAATMAVQLSNAINVSNAVIGPSPSISPTSPTANQVTLNSLTLPGTSIYYSGSLTGTGATIAPATLTPFAPTGDTMTFYYSSTGDTLSNAGDTPGIPAIFHMALVYKVLSDYWLVKQDDDKAEKYLKRYDRAVKMAHQYTFDINRATQDTIAGDDDSGWNMYGPGIWY